MLLQLRSQHRRSSFRGDPREQRRLAAGAGARVSHRVSRPSTRAADRAIATSWEPSSWTPARPSATGPRAAGLPPGSSTAYGDQRPAVPPASAAAGAGDAARPGDERHPGRLSLSAASNASVSVARGLRQRVVQQARRPTRDARCRAASRGNGGAPSGSGRANRPGLVGRRVAAPRSRTSTEPLADGGAYQLHGGGHRRREAGPAWTAAGGRRAAGRREPAGRRRSSGRRVQRPSDRVVGAGQPQGAVGQLGGERGVTACRRAVSVSIAGSTRLT